MAPLGVCGVVCGRVVFVAVLSVAMFGATGVGVFACVPIYVCFWIGGARSEVASCIEPFGGLAWSPCYLE